MTSHHIIKDGSAYSCLDGSARISQALLSPFVDSLQKYQEEKQQRKPRNTQ